MPRARQRDRRPRRTRGRRAARRPRATVTDARRLERHRVVGLRPRDAGGIGEATAGRAASGRRGPRTTTARAFETKSTRRRRSLARLRLFCAWRGVVDRERRRRRVSSWSSFGVHEPPLERGDDDRVRREQRAADDPEQRQRQLDADAAGERLIRRGSGSRRRARSGSAPARAGRARSSRAGGGRGRRSCAARGSRRRPQTRSSSCARE